MDEKHGYSCYKKGWYLMKLDKKKVGQRLAIARARAGLSQENVVDAGGACGCDQVSKWEHGTNLPRMHNLLKLAELYGVSLDWLCGQDKGCTVTFFHMEEELSALTGLDHNGLWDAGFDLDDWDWGFVSDTEWSADWNHKIPEYEYTILNWMDARYVGYRHTVYQGRHYYMQYHS